MGMAINGPQASNVAFKIEKIQRDVSITWATNVSLLFDTCINLNIN